MDSADNIDSARMLVFGLRDLPLAETRRQMARRGASCLIQHLVTATDPHLVIPSVDGIRYITPLKPTEDTIARLYQNAGEGFS